MKNFSIKKILILVTILAVPGFLYYLLQDKGKNRYRPLPFFGPKTVANTFHSVRGKKVPDTLYHQIADFKLLDQKGATVTWDTYKGKILILNLFYTKGTNFGVTYANKAIKAFEFTYGKNRILNFASVTIDPIHDTPEVLDPYAKQLQAKYRKWDFLTGDSAAVYSLVNKQLFIDALQTKDANGKKFIYSNLFVLIDPQHRIRGYYEATSQEALSKLDDEIKVLITEELRNNTDGR